MRWVVAMATFCCSVYGEENQVLEKENQVLEKQEQKGNQVLEILDLVLDKENMVYSAQTSTTTGRGGGGEDASGKADGFNRANNEWSQICSLPKVSIAPFSSLCSSFSPSSPTVPFAQPPVGKLRLRDPLPKKGFISDNDRNNAMTSNNTIM